MGTKNQTSTVQQSIPGWLSGAYQDLISKGQALQSSGTYHPYTGGFTADQQAAFSNIANLGGSAAPYFNAANQNYTNGVVPAYQNVASYESPYNQAVIDATQKQFNLQNAQQQQGVIGNAIAKGAMGGNRVGVAQAQLAGQQQTAQAPVIAGLYNQNYAQALAAAQAQQQTALTAAAGQTNLGNTAMSTNLAQAQAQLGAGTQQQNYNYQQYLNQQSYPYQQLSWLAGLVNGTGNVGSTATTTSPSGNILSQILGLGLVGGSLFKDGGRVHRDSGGVIPYTLQSSALQPDGTSFPTYISEGMPYSNGSSGIYLPYIPTGSVGHGQHGYVNPAPLPGEDPLTAYLKQQMMVASEARADGGVVRPHLASGGVGDIYGGILQYQPSSGSYSGIYPGAGAPVMLPPSGMNTVPSPATSFAVAPSTGGSGGSTFDVGYDPSYPISSAFNGGWGSPATGSVGLGLTPDSNGFGIVPSYTPSPGVSAYTYDGSSYHPLTSSGNIGNQNAIAAANAQAANDNMNWEPAVATGTSGGDPWAGQRIGGNDYGTTTPGLFTGSRAQPISAGGGHVGLLGGMLGLNGGRTGLDRLFGINGGSGLFGGGTLLGGFFNNLGSHGGSSTSYNAPPVGSNFLNARGVSTSGVNALAPVAANNLNAQLAGSSQRGSFGVASGGSVGDNGMGKNEGVLPQIDWSHSGFDTLIPTLGKFNYDTKGRSESANIEDRRPISDAAVEQLYTNSSPQQPLMDSTKFSDGVPWASDHFTRTGYAAGGAPSIADTYYPGMVGNNGLISLQQPITPVVSNVAPDASSYAGNDTAPPPPDTSGLVPVDTFDPTQYGNTNNGVVPYTQGSQFETQADPRYSQNIGDVFNSLRNGKGLNLSPDVRQSLLAAGAGMMASKSPFPLQGIGEGVLTGVNTWNTRQDIERNNAQIRAQIAQSGQDIATRAAVAQGQIAQMRYEFTPSMGGMVVADKMNPNASQIIPYAQFKGWAQQNGIDPANTPNGGNPPAVANDTPEGTRFTVTPPPNRGVNPMTFTQTGQQIVQNQSVATLDAARQANQAANDTMLQLDALRNSAAQLPSSGFLVPGQWETQRADIAKSLNTLSSMTGTPLNFKPETIASIEEMNKLTTQFGFNLAKTTGSDVAASVVTQGIGAVPSIENTPQGFKAITGLIQAGLNRTRDYYAFLNNWARTYGGDLTGATDYFNQVAPPSVYAEAAILSSAVVPKSQADIDSAPSGTMFNINGKLKIKP